MTPNPRWPPSGPQSGRKLDLHSRDGVTFHDGTKLTVRGRRQLPQQGRRRLTQAPHPRRRGPDREGRRQQRHRHHRHRGPAGPAAAQLAAAVDPRRQGLPGEDRRSRSAPGTGPFELTKVNGTSSAALDRYDGYWGSKAKAPGIDVRFVPDGTARAAALRSGEADIVEAVPVSQAAVLDQDLITEVPMPRTNTLYLNTEKGAFKDAALRAAAREAIDAESIVEGRVRGTRRRRRRAARSRAALGGRAAGAGEARQGRRPGRQDASPSAPSPTAPSCPRSPPRCNSSCRRPGSR